jgi:hypothetical protein
MKIISFPADDAALREKLTRLIKAVDAECGDKPADFGRRFMLLLKENGLDQVVSKKINQQSPETRPENRPV